METKALGDTRKLQSESVLSLVVKRMEAMATMKQRLTIAAAISHSQSVKAKSASFPEEHEQQYPVPLALAELEDDSELS